MVAAESFVVRSAADSFENYFRITARGSDLYFIQLPGVSPTIHLLTAQLGLIGFLINSVVQRRARTKAASGVNNITGEQDPELALRDNDKNFKLYAAEIQEATVEAPTFWQLRGKQAGRLTFKLRDGTKKKFEFADVEEMKTGMDILSRLLNATLKINAEWDQSKKSFQKAAQIR